MILCRSATRAWNPACIRVPTVAPGRHHHDTLRITANSGLQETKTRQRLGPLVTIAEISCTCSTVCTSTCRHGWSLSVCYKASLVMVEDAGREKEREKERKREGLLANLTSAPQRSEPTENVLRRLGVLPIRSCMSHIPLERYKRSRQLSERPSLAMDLQDLPAVRQGPWS